MANDKKAAVLSVPPDSLDGVAGDVTCYDLQAEADARALGAQPDIPDERAAVPYEEPELATEQWSPDNVKFYTRISESNFAEDKTWYDHLVSSKASLYPIHRLQVRQLPNGKYACRPASYQGDDFVSDTLEEVAA